MSHDVDPALLHRFRDLVEERSGLLVDERKQQALAEAVQEVARARGHDGAEELLPEVLRGQEALDDLISRLTVGETHFFRNRPHFQALESVVFPELLERNASRRALTIWSAGCSTGEEPYSLAMSLDSTAQRLGVDLEGWSVQLLGTDIDGRALDHARAAEYGRYSFRGVTPEEIDRYFEPVGELLRPKARYRWMVDFRRLNLKTDRYPDPSTPFHDVDLVACRNVTIYFGPETTRAVADRFYETLCEGGYLLVGHAEHSLETYRRFQARALPDVILYQRGGDRAPAAAALPVDVPLRPVPAPPELQAPGRSRRFMAPDVPVGATVEATGPLEEASAALADGDVNRAVEAAVAVLEADPGNADACLLLGRLAADRGHVAEAAIWLHKTLELRPLDLHAHYVQALLALERLDRAEALRWLEKAIYLDPDFVMAHYLRCRLQLEAGQREAAARSLRVARAVLAGLPDDLEVPFSQGLSASQLRGVLDRVAP